MKLAAGRDRDIPDIAVLCQALNISTAEAAVDIAVELYGEHSMQLSNRDGLLLVAQEALDRNNNYPSATVDDFYRDDRRIRWC